MTRDEALALAATKWWERATDRQIAEFQLTEPRLCMPFGLFHEAVEKCLGRGVQTIELGMDRDNLVRELLGERKPPTLQEIIGLFPDHMNVMVIGGGDA